MKKVPIDKILLIVEDDVISLNLFYLMCNKKFITVHQARDGFQALEIIKNQKIDIVFTDINMPNMDGIELCQKVLGTHPEIYMGGITAHNEKEIVSLAKDVGYRYIINKPINATLFNALVDDVKKYFSLD